MKVNLFDFIFSGLAFCVLIGLSWVFTFLVASFTLETLGNYAVVVNCLIFVSCYGILSGFLLRGLLLIRPLKCGEFDSDSPEFTYWKLLTMIHYFGYKAMFLFQLAPAMPLLARLFGAKVGSNVAIGGFLDSPFLITVGDNCILGNGSIITGNLHSNGKTIIGPVKIENGATVGVYSLIMPNTKIGEGAVLAPNSILTLGSEVPSGESWKGHPARKWQ